jgi:predicted aspartyl protease
MKIRLQDGLPYVTVTLDHRGQQLLLDNVLLDTGSAGTIFSADKVAALGVQYEPEDMVHRIRGVGGTEFVFTKRVDRIRLGDLVVKSFEVEIGAMDYGYDIEGIVGVDFLIQVGAVIDLANLEIRTTSM